MFVYIWESSITVVAENYIRALEMANSQGMVFTEANLMPTVCYEIVESEDAEPGVY
jgi:hypothetical protein